jgi:hypothetical protein
VSAGRAIRWSTVLAVAAVAAVAGWVSYEHALAVVRAHGEAGAVAQVYPVTVDGLIYSASMVLLDAARRGAAAPGLARWLLGAGIGATLAANVAAGLHYGPVGAVVAAWPAAALVGSYELLMLIIRSSAARVPAATTVHLLHTEVVSDSGRSRPERGEIYQSGSTAPEDAPAVPGVPDPFAALNGHRQAAAELFAGELSRGELPSIRAIRSGLHIGQDKASEVQAYLRTLTRTP